MGDGGMIVQELIDKLNEIEDKELNVCYFDHHYDDFEQHVETIDIINDGYENRVTLRCRYY